MGNISGTGSWNEEESAVLIQAYFSMLNDELSGRPYKKTDANKKVRESTGRTKGSIEFKFCNISAVLNSMGFPYIKGYKPRSHFQASLSVQVEKHISLLYLADITETDTTGTVGLANNIEGVAMSEPFSTDEHDEAPEGGLDPTGGDVLSAAVDFWARCDWLWDRATGGSDVAVAPDSQINSVWPTAQRPAGVAEGCEWIRQAVDEGFGPRLLFLVGGPGAGKSHATALVTAGLTLTNSKNDGLAQRLYEYEGVQNSLKVINDATIIEHDEKDAALSRDITEAVQSGSNLMACINRGILVEEAAGVSQKSPLDYDAGDIITLWLEGEIDDGQPASNWNVSDRHSTPFHWQGTLTEFGEPRARVMVVFVDVCSLYERRPILAKDNGLDNGMLQYTDYQVALLHERSKIQEVDMPAADLMTSILDVVGDPTETGTDLGFCDPVAANVSSLNSERVRCGVFTIARASEIVASSRMTYREVWGLSSRCLVGNAPEFLRRGEIQKWISDNQPSGNDRGKIFLQLKKLASLRFSQSIFGAGDIAGQGFATGSNPVLRFLSVVDPVRDSIPGHNDGGSESGWSTPVSEAMSGYDGSESPLSALLRSSSDTAFSDAVHQFDWEVDEAYQNLMFGGSSNQSQRSAAMSWYGSYLTRLYAVSLGIPAFRSQIAMWISARRHCPHLPDGLEKRLKTLLHPRRISEDSISPALIPVFDSRTDAITGRLESPKIALRLGAIDLKTRIRNDELLLELAEDGSPMGTMSLDFPLVREAMACSDSYTGVTDLIDATAPRLERIRSSRLLSRHLDKGQYRMVIGDQDIQLTFSEKGQ